MSLKPPRDSHTPYHAGEAPVFDGDEFQPTNIATQSELDAVNTALDARLDVLEAGGGGVGASLTDAHIFNLYDFGGLGDGTGRLLSANYASLAAAQVDYPGATALTQSIDDGAWLSAIAAAQAAQVPASAQRTVTVKIPAGLWRNTEEWVASNCVNIDGDGYESTVVQALTDFGKGRFVVRWTGLKVNRQHVRGLGISGPFRSSPAKGASSCNMNGIQIPGGGCIAEEMKVEYCYAGYEMCSDHSTIKTSLGQTNYYNLYFGSDVNAEADQYIDGCDFANSSFASIGIKGSNDFGGVTVVSTHLGYGPYCIYKESSTATGSTPTATPVAGGSTGAPFTAGGTFFYFVTALFGAGFSTSMVSTVSSSTVVAAGGHVNLSWAAVTGATGYRIYRSTTAAPAVTASLTYLEVGAVTSTTDTGPGTSTGTPQWPNPLAVSGCTFIDCPGESYGHGYIFCENGTDQVTGNVWINAATANPFDVNNIITSPATAQRAAVTCGIFDGNVLTGDCGSITAIGPDSDGCSILAAAGTTGNTYRAKEVTWLSNSKPFWTSTNGTPRMLLYEAGGLLGSLVQLATGTITQGDVIVAHLSNSRVKTALAGDTSPVLGVAAQSMATLNAFLVMWQGGVPAINSADTNINGHNLYVKIDPANAGQIVKANGRMDGPAIGVSYAGRASGKVSTWLFPPGLGGGSSALGLKALTATGTLTHQDDVVTVDTTAGNVTVNLPTAVGFTGRTFRVKRITAGANTCTIDPSGAQTVDGAATLALASQWDKTEIVSDGANWLTV